MYEYMKKTYRQPYTTEELMVPIFREGRQVYEIPSLEAVKKRATSQVESLEPEYKRLPNPHLYKVSLSNKLHKIKRDLLSYYEDKNQISKK
jgi:nicotinate phosphoribosyltransferase